jgi:DNA modification methylase
MKPYYEHGGITIYNGDCRELFAAAVPSDAVIATDPPYGTGQKFYDVYRDTMAEWLPLMEWLLSLPHPTVFTMSHSRLFDLPKRPQWVGCWDKVITGGIVHVGASPCWEPVCFYNLPAGDRGKRRWDDVFRVQASGFQFNNLDKESGGHPCPKPIDLYKRLIATLPAGVVVDPMMGSGTTLRAAKDVGRSAIGFDLSERYCEIAARRMSQEVLPLAMGG